jgi:hypothetical protein
MGESSSSEEDRLCNCRPRLLVAEDGEYNMMIVS